MDIKKIIKNVKLLFKSIEAVFIMAFALVCYLTGVFGWLAALILVGGYIALNLTGWGVKALWEARDAVKNKK